MNDDPVVALVEHLENQGMPTKRAMQHASQKFGVDYNEISDRLYNDSYEQTAEEYA